MTYDNNDGPVYSVLSGKILNEGPCFYGDPCAGPGSFCATELYGTTRFATVNDALNECNTQADNTFYNWNTEETLTNGNCLGAWQGGLVGHFDSDFNNCEPNSPGCTAVYNLNYAICWS